MRKVFTLFLFALVGNLFAEEVTYDFSQGIPSTWSTSQTPAGTETANLARGTQFTANATLTLRGVSNVTKVVVTCSCNIADGNSIGITVGGTSWGTENLVKESNVEKTFTGAAASGNLVLDITRSTKSVWIKKIVVTGNVEGGSGDGGGSGSGDSQELDPNYTYAEPTQISISGETCSNAAYSFVQNNIQVSTTTGAQTSSYFGCNAGANITFTATKPIKALVINGYVKKDFYAESTSGDITFVDASEDYVEANPVLIVKDVDNESITITCEKQLRCYGVTFYFTENPDIEIEDAFTGGGGEDGFSYEWEPTAKTNLNIVFTDAEYEEYTEDLGYAYTSIYFANEDFEMEIGAYATSVEETILAKGTYEINNSYAEGTIQASPGGDEYYDYPTYISTGFEQDPESGDWYYTISYYVVSGTLTVDDAKMELKGKTYNGSTVNAVYAFNPAGIKEVNDNANRNAKYLRDGRIMIRHNGRTFNSLGQELKN